jgi:hypothetical protein
MLKRISRSCLSADVQAIGGGAGIIMGQIDR